MFFGHVLTSFFLLGENGNPDRHDVVTVGGGEPIHDADGIVVGTKGQAKVLEPFINGSGYLGGWRISEVLTATVVYHHSSFARFVAVQVFEGDRKVFEVELAS